MVMRGLVDFTIGNFESVVCLLNLKFSVPGWSLNGDCRAEGARVREFGVLWDSYSLRPVVGEY